jgi:hypothetical protein
MRMLAKRKADRHPNMQAVAYDLQRLLTNRPLVDNHFPREDQAAAKSAAFSRAAASSRRACHRASATNRIRTTPTSVPLMALVAYALLGFLLIVMFLFPLLHGSKPRPDLAQATPSHSTSSNSGTTSPPSNDLQASASTTSSHDLLLHRLEHITTLPSSTPTLLRARAQLLAELLPHLAHRADLAEQAKSLLARDEQQLDREAAKCYEETLKQAQMLVEGGALDAALKLWDAFDPAWLDATWLAKVRAARSQLERQSAAIEASTAIDVEPGDFPPPGWSSLRSRSASLYLTRPRIGQPWPTTGNELVLEGKDEIDSGVLLVHVQGSLHQFRNVYVTFEVLPIRGGMSIQMLAPITGTQHSLEFVLTPENADWYRHGTWHRLHIVYQDRRLTWWLHGHSQRNGPFDGSIVDEGAIVFKAYGGDAYKLRDFRCYLGSLGNLVQPR